MLWEQKHCKSQLTLSKCSSLHHAYNFAYCLYIEHTLKREQNLRVKNAETLFMLLKY
jgi:hypothetical protein